MRGRDRLFSENDVAFAALELRVLLSRKILERKRPAFIRRSGCVAHAARRNADAFCGRIQCVHLIDTVTCSAAQLGMACEFVTELTRRIALPPCIYDHFLDSTHPRGQPCIEIRRGFLGLDRMTPGAVIRRDRKTGICRMTRKTGRMPGRNALECSAFQPEAVANVSRRLCLELIAAFALRVDRLVTDSAAFLGLKLRQSERRELEFASRRVS